MSETDTVTGTAAPSTDAAAPSPFSPPVQVSTYAKTEFHALFPEYEPALEFAQEPWFRGENTHQNSVLPVIAKSGDLDFLVAFTLYHAPAQLPALTEKVRELANAHGGKLDGDPDPEPEPEPEVIPDAKSTPW